MHVGGEMARGLYKLATLDFSSEFQDAITKTTSTTYYLYPEIKILTKIANYSILCIALISLCKLIVDLDVGRGIRRLFLQLKSHTRASHATDLYFLAVAFLCFSFSVPLLLSGLGGSGFMERSYFFFVFAIMAYIGSILQGSLINARRTWKKKFAILSLTTWFVFLALIYPMTAYHTDAYTACPFSEGIGMNFVSSKTLLDTKTISVYLPQQFASYVDPRTQINPLYCRVSSFGENFSDIVVFRRTGYFSASLGYDLSLDNNSYTRALNRIELFSNFSKIYSNPTFEVYTKSQE